ncbi:MAG: hypothetical protein QXP98_00055 [Thermoproteus sp.]
MSIVQASFASDAVYLAQTLTPSQFFEVFLWYYLSLAASRVIFGYAADWLGSGVLLRASLVFQLLANLLTGFAHDWASASVGRLLRGLATNAMIIGVLEGASHAHFRKLYGLTELAMAAGYSAAYVAPRQYAYVAYSVSTLFFVFTKPPSAAAAPRLTISKSIVPIAVSESFLNAGLALTVPIALKLSVGDLLMPGVLALAVLTRAVVQLASQRALGAAEVAVIRTAEAAMLYSMSYLHDYAAAVLYLAVNAFAGYYRPSVGLLIRKAAHRAGDLGFHYFLRDVGSLTGSLLGIWLGADVFKGIALCYLSSAAVLAFLVKSPPART